MTDKKEELVSLINHHALPFCDNVYALAEAMLKWHQDEMDKNLADTRNKMSPIANLIAMIERQNDPDALDHRLDKIITREIKQAKKSINYICQTKKS